MFLHIDSEKGLSASEKLGFEDAMRLIGTAALAMMDGLDEHVKKNAADAGEYEKTHGYIYDTFNTLAANVLDAFDSTKSPGTDLTAQAILEAENAILDREVPDTPADDEEPTDSPA